MTSRAYDLDFYLRHQQEGLDWLSYGQWQVDYGCWIVETLGLHGRRVLDLGCGCGGQLRGLRAAGADIVGVDCSEALIRLGREHWPDMASRLLVCDAANMHLLPDESFDWVHSQVVAEHWPPGLVRHIFLEVRRVLKPEGCFFCSYDSEETFLAEGHDGEDEPTHVCIRPQAWWEERIRQAGYRVCSAAFEPALKEHPLSFLGRYAWSWFVARKNRPRNKS